MFQTIMPCYVSAHRKLETVAKHSPAGILDDIEQFRDLDALEGSACLFIYVSNPCKCLVIEYRHAFNQEGSEIEMV